MIVSQFGLEYTQEKFDEKEILIIINEGSTSTSQLGKMLQL